MGATAAQAMLDNCRIRAESHLDGSMYGPVLAGGLDRPFLLMCSQLDDIGDDPTGRAEVASARLTRGAVAGRRAQFVH
ncbi:hypothetical protein Caci_5505 [Catenulispora acidiphila DSM 44928]|uniref:Uncharacterized protein n=1 Tax=Catenulispora acidiphila (strain DSM 44928 / JCM 14897 / NBRC 102108 / NRRL B-24433 / ID139908) TaxID=479433 RepID=C7QAP1_CATAD|nr:hypothetical protein [Catenulispora acidiphila]ACU74364.1 hypothetical protein Caci_5505 [Catenulispora acidiphila DSM 44928]